MSPRTVAPTFYEPGYLIRESAPGFVVWSGWHTSTRLPSCFTHGDIVGYGATREAAEAIVRLLEDENERMKAGIGPSGERGIQKL